MDGLLIKWRWSELEKGMQLMRAMEDHQGWIASRSGRADRYIVLFFHRSARIVLTV